VELPTISAELQNLRRTVAGADNRFHRVSALPHCERGALASATAASGARCSESMGLAPSLIAMLGHATDTVWFVGAVSLCASGRWQSSGGRCPIQSDLCRTRGRRPRAARRTERIARIRIVNRGSPQTTERDWSKGAPHASLPIIRGRRRGIAVRVGTLNVRRCSDNAVEGRSSRMRAWPGLWDPLIDTRPWQRGSQPADHAPGRDAEAASYPQVNGAAGKRLFLAHGQLMM